MSAVFEAGKSIFISTPATIVNDDYDTASSWASKYITANDSVKWILAKYVEADNANSNNQYWTLNDLRIKHSTVSNTPMNIDHKRAQIVGNWAGSELLYPTDSAAVMNPYVEVIGSFWRRYFPEEFAKVEESFERGSLFVSMECYSDTITCVGTDVACEQTFEYRGPIDSSYCDHINDRASFRQFNNPTFIGGALIVPPNKPGWQSASVDDLSEMITKHEEDLLMAELETAAGPDVEEFDLRATLDAIVRRSRLESTLERFTTIS